MRCFSPQVTLPLLFAVASASILGAPAVTTWGAAPAVLGASPVLASPALLRAGPVLAAPAPWAASAPWAGGLVRTPIISSAIIH
jgi:hypothetical protein